MAQQIVVISNPTSGTGSGARTGARAADLLRARGREVVELAGRDAAEAEALVRRAVAEGPDLLVVVGGDGMVHLALQSVSGSGVRLGLVPAGTGNDVARYLDVPRGDVEAAVEVLLGGVERELDVAVVDRGPGAEERRFLTVMAAGFDAVVNERANAMRWPRGQARYTVATLAELRTLAPIPYVLELDGRTEQLEATMVAVGNGPSFGGGLRITEGAELDDGLLDVVVIAPLSRRELVRTYPRLFRGTHVSHPSYSHHRVRQVRVAAPGITAYADGERLGALPLSVGVEPGALRVMAGAGR